MTLPLRAVLGMRQVLCFVLGVGCRSRLHITVGAQKQWDPALHPIAPVDPATTPNAFIRNQSGKYQCSVFGLSFDLKTILLKHLLLREGGKCKVFDLDRFQCAEDLARSGRQSKKCQLNHDIWAAQLRKMPVIYIGGKSFGGLLDVENLEKEPGKDVLEEELEHADATMLNHCPPGLQVEC